MDIFFQDPADIPLPPDEVRIRRFEAAPWPDNRRVRISLEITPFLKRPNGEVEIVGPDGQAAARLTIIETITPRMEFTVHLRGQVPPGEYTASATVYYAEAEDQAGDAEQAAPATGLRPGTGGEQEKPPPPLPTRITVVDRMETKFEIHR
jgi:hypothetical protein